MASLRKWFSEVKKTEDISTLVQRATYYSVYFIEYHPIYMMGSRASNYSALTLFDHCYNLYQLLPIYELIEKRIQNAIEAGKIAPCPEQLKACFEISKGMRKDLEYFSSAIESEKLSLCPAAKKYFDFLSQVECSNRLFGHYLMLLGMNFYGGTFAIKPSLRVICDTAGVSPPHGKDGLSAFPLRCIPTRSSAEKATNRQVKLWIDHSHPDLDALVQGGYRHAAYYLKMICDAVLNQSVNKQALLKLDKNFLEGIGYRRSAPEDDLIVRLEAAALHGKHKAKFKEKGYHYILGMDDEQISQNPAILALIAMKKTGVLRIHMQRPEIEAKEKSPATLRVAWHESSLFGVKERQHHIDFDILKDLMDTPASLDSLVLQMADSLPSLQSGIGKQDTVKLLICILALVFCFYNINQRSEEFLGRGL